MIGQETELALRHPLRVALLDLLAAAGSVTANEAARRLGESSGACSFHLRQLERYGYVEPVAGAHGRARPWRLRPSAQPRQDLGPLARELEDEGYHRWLARRDTAPEHWQRDEAFSDVLHLTPAELATVADEIRAVLAPYTRREPPPTSAPVGVVARLFPLIPEADA
ncbi:winged helix-turn-helix domain-containing protein [Asanoa sp. WMMD1127]|uniref:winged helix-turn-helix domain-containing protein n=1 Tax=Asanoa sp. WMMD1127 TaxID=3016107 RepID=UPI00241760AD|nr:winged helix-turn-helix domain-containing protein [Asanoa sp. WMMD1127]MDG4824115.1 winged helix-turn-helix domain-containing protein [Asanoa sp. WMMD1127]